MRKIEGREYQGSKPRISGQEGGESRSFQQTTKSLKNGGLGKAKKTWGKHRSGAHALKDVMASYQKKKQCTSRGSKAEGGTGRRFTKKKRKRGAALKGKPR